MKNENGFVKRELPDDRSFVQRNSSSRVRGEASRPVPTSSFQVLGAISISLYSASERR